MLIRYMQDSRYRYANTYVLKTYRSKDAREHYYSEVKAFKALMPGGALGKSIIGFHGSFIQDGSYNVLLEYADRGTLEHYLETISPPTTGDDTYKLWSAMFNLIKALKLIHDVQPIDPNDPPILRG
jgi:serine/threonine protein kinase